MLRRIIYGTLGVVGLALALTYPLPLIPPEFGDVTVRPMLMFRNLAHYAVSMTLLMFGGVGVVFNPPLLLVRDRRPGI